MLRNEGFSLLELLIALLLGALLSGALLAALCGFQKDLQLLHRLYCQAENTSLLPLLLTRWIPHAGNRQWKTEIPGIGIQSGRLTLVSDIDGSGGFPDGDLEDSFESLSLWADRGELRLKSGSGTFQPLIQFIEAASFSRQGATRLESRVVTSTGNGLLRIPDPLPREESFQFYLWNGRSNLFREAPE